MSTLAPCYVSLRRNVQMSIDCHRQLIVLIHCCMDHIMLSAPPLPSPLPYPTNCTPPAFLPSTLPPPIPTAVPAGVPPGGNELK